MHERGVAKSRKSNNKNRYCESWGLFDYVFTAGGARRCALMFAQLLARFAGCLIAIAIAIAIEVEVAALALGLGFLHIRLLWKRANSPN